MTMYSDIMNKMTSQIGEPLVSTSHQEMSKNMPLDMSSLMMILALIIPDLFKKPTDVPTQDQTQLAPFATGLPGIGLGGLGGAGNMTSQFLMSLLSGKYGR